MDFEPHTCLSFIFSPLTEKTFECMLGFSFTPMESECQKLLIFMFLYFFFLWTIILVWRMQKSFTEASDFQTLTPSSPNSKLTSSEDVSVLTQSCEWKTQSFSLCIFIGVQQGNEIHRICCCSFNSVFQKVRHNRINKEFLTAYHQFWENVHKSQQTCLIVDLWT